MVERRKHLTGEAFTSIEEVQAGLREPDTRITLDEGQRQMTLLALARLGAARPGFIRGLEDIALKMDNHTWDGKPDTFTRLLEIAINDQR